MNEAFKPLGEVLQQLDFLSKLLSEGQFPEIQKALESVSASFRKRIENLALAGQGEMEEFQNTYQDTIYKLLYKRGVKEYAMRTISPDFALSKEEEELMSEITRSRTCAEATRRVLLELIRAFISSSGNPEPISREYLKMTFNMKDSVLSSIKNALIGTRFELESVSSDGRKKAYRLKNSKVELP